MKKTPAGRAYHEYVHGTQVISTAIGYYKSAPDKVSQRVGDILMVNNDTYPDAVAGNSTIGIHAGLGNMFDRNKCRQATFADEGFLATKEEWMAHFGVTKHFKAQRNFLVVIIAFLFITLMMVCLK